MSAAVDCELSLREEQVFLLHLSECQECKDELEEAKNTKMIIKEKIVQFKAPQTLINSIMELTSVTRLEQEDSVLFE